MTSSLPSGCARRSGRSSLPARATVKFKFKCWNVLLDHPDQPGTSNLSSVRNEGRSYWFETLLPRVLFFISYTISYIPIPYIVTIIVYDVAADVVYDVVYDAKQELYSCALAAASAASRRRFRVAAPLRLDSATRSRRITSASFTETFLGNALP